MNFKFLVSLIINSPEKGTRGHLSMYVGNQETEKPLRLHNLYHLMHVGQLPIGIPAAKKEQFFFI